MSLLDLVDIFIGCPLNPPLLADDPERFYRFGVDRQELQNSIGVFNTEYPISNVEYRRRTAFLPFISY
jgi:hypothetical protein